MESCFMFIWCRKCFFFFTADRVAHVSVTFDFVLKCQNLNEEREAKGHSNHIITLCLAPDPAIGVWYIKLHATVMQ